MNHEEMFNTWKRHKERIEVSPDFPEQVMAHLGEGQAPRQASAAASVSLVRRVVARPGAKAAIVILGVLAGLLRIVVTLDLILRA